MSRTDTRYASTHWANHPQPVQDIEAEYVAYIQSGYDDNGYWKRELPHRRNAGVWVTCFYAVDLRAHKREAAITFLQHWSAHIKKYTILCQLSFAYLAQMLRIYPYGLPDTNIFGSVIFNNMYWKQAHGS